MAMALSARFAPAVGAVSASRLVTATLDSVDELYDYDALRRFTEPTEFVVHVQQSTVVLGSRQRASLLTEEFRSSVALRRRRGGGGMVLLQPEDLWVDWWIPADDARWSRDLRDTSHRAGNWWRTALSDDVAADFVVHTGPLEVDSRYDVVCFAGRGPGEVFADGRKVVGVTQWRVREGAFVSTVLHGHSTLPLLKGLVDRPSGLADVLEHHTIESLKIDDPDAVVRHLTSIGGPWNTRLLLLTD